MQDGACRLKVTPFGGQMCRLPLFVKGPLCQYKSCRGIAAEAMNLSFPRQIHCFTMKEIDVSHGFLMTRDLGVPNSTTVTRAGNVPSDRDVCRSFFRVRDAISDSVPTRMPETSNRALF